MELLAASNLARALMAEHLSIEWTFHWDNAQSRGGQCRYRTKTISMSRHLVPLWTEAQVRETVLHEIAHALVGPEAQAHGEAWYRAARSIGSTGSRTHSNATVPGKWRAVCENCGPKPARYRKRRNLYCKRCWMVEGVRIPFTYVLFDSVSA